MRKSNSRRLNLSQVVHKQKSRLPSLQSVQEADGDGPSLLRKQREEEVKNLAKLCWSVCCKVCNTFCLAPITVDAAEFRAKSSPMWKVVTFYINAAALILIAGGHKYITLARRLFSDMPLDSVTCFCVLPCVIYSAYAVFAISLMLQVHDIKVIFHGWRSVLSYVSPEDGPRLSPFDDLKSCMAAIQIFGAIVGSSFGYTVTCVGLPDLPFLVGPTLEELGWIDRRNLGSTLWGLLLSPVETILYIVPLTFLTFMFEVLVLEIGVVKIAVAEIRKETTDISSHLRQLKLYNRLRVSVKLFNVWLQSVLVPLLFCIETDVVFLVYLVLRNDKLPGFVVVIIGYAAFVIMAALFFLTYDVVLVAQGSEEIVKNLQSLQHKYYQMIKPDVKAGLLKSARALKPLEIPVGNFATFGFGVTQVIYEEILNQLLFLLTL